MIANLAAPEGLAFAPDGRLIVAEVGAHRVIAVSCQRCGGGSPRIILPSVLMAVIPARSCSLAYRQRQDGAIYVTGDMENVLYRLTALQSLPGP